eukprot:comp65363_c0_seq1/m.47989 comp65363_c0_seq1/g.47989  ORF comp65363_c0_seq1/g.47989 comp65363_c0_seq1/m.47989 type:complete len:384 (-) comp65363_c0_seq1:304-1455(-)
MKVKPTVLAVSSYLLFQIGVDAKHHHTHMHANNTVTHNNSHPTMLASSGRTGIGFKPIIGGTALERNESPSWMVSVRSYNGKTYSHYCGGTVIDSSWVLTAAHCVYERDPTRLRIYIGGASLASNGEFLEKNVAALYPHPSYGKGDLLDDIGLIQLSTPTKNRPISTRASENAIVPDSPLSVIGWGSTVVTDPGAETNRPTPLSDALLRVTVPATSNTKCSAVFFLSNAAMKQMFCAGGVAGKDACQGDSGGPILDDRMTVQLGVVAAGRGCGIARNPGLYTRVSYYNTWIQDTIDANSNKNSASGRAQQTGNDPYIEQTEDRFLGLSKNTWIYIGAGVGAGVFVATVMLVGVVMYRRRRQRKLRQESRMAVYNQEETLFICF